MFFAHVGGNFNNGANDGVFYWNLNNTSGNTNINIGSRLLMEQIKRILFSIALAKNMPRTDGVSREAETPIGKHKKYEKILKYFQGYCYKTECYKCDPQGIQKKEKEKICAENPFE